MSHEPIILDRENWAEAHAMVQYNLNRCVSNIHDERERLNAQFLALSDKREQAARDLADQRERDREQIIAMRAADLLRIADRYDPLFSRMSSAETRAAIYGAIAGFFASGVLAAVIAFIKH